MPKLTQEALEMMCRYLGNSGEDVEEFLCCLAEQGLFPDPDPDLEPDYSPGCADDCEWEATPDYEAMARRDFPPCP